MPYSFKHGDRPLDDYTIQRAVGSGGFGEVYYAVSDGGREVALKYLKQNPDVELRGVSHCINLKSPYLVSIFDVKKSADGEYFIIMEYCSGPSLRDLLIAEPDGFGAQKAAFFTREIAKGLSYLHDRGIVHRDMKPGNIFYDDGYVKIGDYGLSKFIAVSRHSAQTASVGTVHYMAPEIGSGNYSRSVDVYALGVILYEMLLGKVPFEGSTMAEVLMKHLTTQPEVAGLPDPYGNIIRRALEKDPQDRYQTIDEMVDDLLGVEEVRKSLAGFSTESLAGAVNKGAADRAQSPVPSPNPPPGWADGARASRPQRGWRRPPPNLDAREAFSKRLAKRQDRISRKLSKKMAKLGHRVPATPPSHGGQEQHAAHLPVLVSGHQRRRRILLWLFTCLGLAVALGVIVANACEGGLKGSFECHVPAGVGSAMLVMAMAGGILLSRVAVGWFGVAGGPKWARYFVRLGSCAPFMAIGASPIMAEVQGGFTVWLGMLVVATFAKWEKALERDGPNDVSIWSAIWTGIGGALATAIATGVFDVNNDQLMPVGFGIAGVASIAVQTASWWQPRGAGRPWGAVASTPQSPTNDWSYAESPGPEQDPVAPAGQADYAPSPPPYHEGGSVMEPGMAPGATRSLERWGITRAFWGLMAFMLMGGALILLMLTLISSDLNHDEKTGSIVGCVACASVMLFAFRKTTPLRRPGFWSESVRPLLTSVALFGVAATIAGLARNFDSLHDDERVMIFVGMFFSIGLLAISGSRCKTKKRADSCAQPALDRGMGAGDGGAAGEAVGPVRDTERGVTSMYGSDRGCC